MMLQLKPVTDDVIRVSQNDELVKKDVALAAARDRNQRSSAMYVRRPWRYCTLSCIILKSHKQSLVRKKVD